jgi:hypothetical protein
MEADVRLERATTVLFNQNWNEHWTSPSGKVQKVGEKWPHDLVGGRLGVEVGPGAQTVVVRYLPRSFVVGAVVSGCAIPLAIVIWLYRRRLRLV